MNVSVEEITAKKTQWEQASAGLQQQQESLRQEINRLATQLEQLSGAIQACEVLISTAQPSVETPVEVS